MGCSMLPVLRTEFVLEDSPPHPTATMVAPHCYLRTLKVSCEQEIKVDVMSVAVNLNKLLSPEIHKDRKTLLLN
jgi:hypothetical protein